MSNVGQPYSFTVGAPTRDEWGLDPPKPPIGIGHHVRFGWLESIRAVTDLQVAVLSGVSLEYDVPFICSPRYDNVVLVYRIDPCALPTYVVTITSYSIL